MGKEIVYNLGEQPIGLILTDNGLKPEDLVRSSTEQITFKMVSRAVKGRRLTSHVKRKLCNALNKASGKRYAVEELFNY